MSVLLLISQQAIHHQSHHVMSQYGEGTGGEMGLVVFISRAQDAHNQCNLEKKPDGLR